MKRRWIFLVLVVGGFIGTALTLSYRPITGPPDGIFWVVFLLPVLKLLISWPVAALIVAFVFRRQIASLISRMTKGPGATEFGPPPSAEAQAAAKREGTEISGELSESLSGVEARATGAIEGLSRGESRATGTIEGLTGVESRATGGDVTVAPAEEPAEATATPESTDQVIQNMHPAVAERFQILNEIVAPGEPAEDRLKRTLVDLADLQVRFGFEKTYRLITGSQIDAVLHLHARPWGVPEDDLKPIYQQDPATAKSLTWDTWRWFLAWSGLVQIDEKGIVRITPLGELFLSYLLRERYTDRKSL